MNEAKKNALYGQVAYLGRGRLLSQKGQRTIVDATIREWEDEKEKRPGLEPREDEIINHVKEDKDVLLAVSVGPHRFIPLPIIIAIIGWIVTWIITYLKKDAAYSRPHDHLGAD